MRSGDVKGVYVEADCCTSCGVPWTTAPSTFADGPDSCVVVGQPTGVTELRRVLRVMRTQELGCVRYGGRDVRVLDLLRRAGCREYCDAKPSVLERSALLWRLAHVEGSRVLATLVSADVLTKALASALLAPDMPVDTGAVLQLVLRTNSSGSGSWAHALGTASQPAQQVAGSMGWVAAAGFLLATRARPWSLLRRAALVVLVIFVGSIISTPLLPYLTSLPAPWVVALARVGGAVGFTTLWWIVKPGLWKVALTLFSAAALGNLMGLIVPPNEVIDFIYSRPVSLVFHQGVVNLADLYYDAGLTCVAVIVVRWLASQMRRRPTLV